ncbi:cell wall hydrolase [Sphingomonas sp. RB56-2]|uniref:Cell wall hydrolase n=1 Tax=Sphingomonas brevis TaxID=2908206 RepID=A0ABT0SB39_9SPHN|nr:cell wall hydrolase [Sphingomonas brevis]MCL6741616.1 cell wall hydrolase [Sphingomonas brevis]
MFVPFRSTFLVIAALTGSSVAPAQVNPNAAPMPAAEWTPLPDAPVEQLLQQNVDPLAPAPEAESATVQSPDDTIEPGETLAETVAKLRSSDPGSRELECLAGAIYFESKSESLSGQLAVGHVIANRAASGRFPSSYCGVVYQRSQFSFVRGHSMPYIPRASQDWKDAVAIAKIVDEKLHPSPMGKALFFHARRVSPGWRMSRVGTLGNHIFYR